jgi:hypothetical protein
MRNQILKKKIKFLILTGFWPTNSLYYEHPAVNLRSEYILMANKDNNNLFYSNKENIKIKNNDEISPILKIKKIDENMDNLIDAFEFFLGFEGGKDVRRIDLFIFFDYGLKVKLPKKK